MKWNFICHEFPPIQNFEVGNLTYSTCLSNLNWKLLGATYISELASLWHKGWSDRTSLGHVLSFYYRVQYSNINSCKYFDFFRLASTICWWKEQKYSIQTIITCNVIFVLIFVFMSHDFFFFFLIFPPHFLCDESETS